MDPVTFKQLTNRKTEWAENGKLRVQPKEKMKAEGLKSPDRADALLGCIVCGPEMGGAMTSESIAVTRPSAFQSRAVRGFNSI